MSCHDSDEVRPALGALAAIPLQQSEADQFHGARFNFDREYGTEEWWAARLAADETGKVYRDWTAIQKAERRALQTAVRQARADKRITVAEFATVRAAADTLDSPRTLRALRERLEGGPARCDTCGSERRPDPATGRLVPCPTPGAAAHRPVAELPGTRGRHAPGWAVPLDEFIGRQVPLSKREQATLRATMAGDAAGADPVPFRSGLTLRRGEHHSVVQEGTAVLAVREPVVASYNGDVLVVDRRWRGQGIAQALVEDYHWHHPAARMAVARTDVSHRILVKAHRNLVIRALRAGLPVPPGVLNRDYPDLIGRFAADAEG